MAGQALPQEGGAKSLYYKPFPLLSWEKGPDSYREGDEADRPGRGGPENNRDRGRDRNSPGKNERVI